MAVTKQRRRYVGLDGIKGFALIAIIIYHCAQSAMPGGFYGVDVFFTVSGFLIALSLFRSLERTGGPDLARYIPRRAARLYPALIMLVPAVVTLAWMTDRDALVGIRDQVVTTLLGCYNWYAIVNGQDYFNQMNPQILRHLWFVGVLMQFYVVVPLIAWLMWRIRRTHLSAVIPLGLAAASGWAMWTLYASKADATRVYFGADTHAVGLLLGVALAWFVAAPHSGPRRTRTAGVDAAPAVPSPASAPVPMPAMRDVPSFGNVPAPVPLPATTMPPSVSPMSRRMLRTAHSDAVNARPSDASLPSRLAAAAAPTVAFVALVALGFMAALGRQDATAFHGGIILASVLSVALIAGTIAPGSWMRDLMVFKPLAALGKYSYGVYLWHWPLWILVTAELPRLVPGADRRWILVATLALTACAATLSWLLVEKPAARHSSLFVVFPHPHPTAAHVLRAMVVDIILIAVVSGCVVGVTNAPEKTSTQIQLEEQARELARMEREARLNGELPRNAVPQPRRTRQMPTGDQITAIGDSVMLASSGGLNSVFPGISIDASVSRSIMVAPGIMRTAMDAGTMRQWVIIGLGTNSEMTTAQLQRVYELIGPDQMLVLVNAHGERAWIPGTNKVMADFAAAHPDNVLLVDWDSAAKANPGVFGSDGIHPNKGSDLYAQTIKAAIERWVGAAD
ncbi:acyltransferase family protein [Bifidobacterium sp. CP2]|uniref:acyltransferase family protein n=1 Tax=Bifidobacterium sp. CP2 TaxID=2809025 RepID=UPI001BDBF11A|nr:acyltransferase family protein [Bifidobacterium sp. CP2]